GGVVDPGADQGIARNRAMGVEVARGFGRRGGGLGIAAGRRRINAGLAEDLAAYLGVAIGIGRHPLELVLGRVDHDLLAVAAAGQVLPGYAHAALAHAQEAADAKDHAVDLAIGIDV